MSVARALSEKTDTFLCEWNHIQVSETKTARIYIITHTVWCLIRRFGEFLFVSKEPDDEFETGGKADHAFLNDAKAIY